MEASYVERGSKDVKEIDKAVKNKWNWSWCDKLLCAGTDEEHIVGDCIRKLLQPGEAYCHDCYCLA